MIEKVNPSHPDKIADRIAGAIVDIAYAQEANPRIAVEVLIGHGRCHVIIETDTELSEDKIRAAIFRIAGKTTRVVSVTTDEYQSAHPAAAPRPHYSILDNYMLRLTTDFTFADWHDALSDYMDQMGYAAKE